MRGVARRYAQALLEIGVEKNKLELFQNQVRELATAFAGSAELRAIISNPGVSVDERRTVVLAISRKAGWDKFIENFCQILIDNDRFPAIGVIADTLDTFVDKHQGNVRATVTTSRALKDSQVAVIKGALTKLTGKNVMLETEVDPAILGGIVTRIGNTVYDGSVATQIATIRDNILQER